MDGGPRRNLELKARLRDIAAARAAAIALGARPVKVLHQCDTFLRGAEGRLKLREIEGEQAELIWYRRIDDPEVRRSDYRLAPVAAPAAVIEVLRAAYGVRGQVRKRRELLVWHNVRVHLDAVEGLGDHVEFEAVLGDGPGEDEETARGRLARLRAALGIGEGDLVDRAYADLLGL